MTDFWNVSVEHLFLGLKRNLHAIVRDFCPNLIYIRGHKTCTCDYTAGNDPIHAKLCTNDHGCYRIYLPELHNELDDNSDDFKTVVSKLAGRTVYNACKRVLVLTGNVHSLPVTFCARGLVQALFHRLLFFHFF